MSIEYLDRDDLPRLAYRKTKASEEGRNLPTVMFCGGFKSDMEGTKAAYFEKQCQDRGQAYIRFDYSGHGSSEGKFEEGTIGSWTADALAIFDELIDGPVLLVGSSMGGWISLLLALERSDRVAGLIGLAAAPDFSREMHDQRFSDQMREKLQSDGFIYLPNDYGEPYTITKELIEDGEKHCLLDGVIDLKMPIRLIQGMKDADVEWQTTHRIKNAIIPVNDDVEVILIEEGDHRLSSPEQLELIDRQINNLCD